MTRVIAKLYLGGHGEVPKFIHDINREFVLLILIYRNVCKIIIFIKR